MRPGIELPRFTLVGTTTNLEGSCAMQALLKMPTVVIGMTQGIAIHAVLVVEHRESPLEGQVKTVPGTIEGNLDFLQWLDHLVGQQAITPGPLGADVPQKFETIAVGRDYFLGAMLRFNDLDLTALLTVGGSALAGATD